MKFDLRQLSPQALWKRQSVRIGAGLTLAGGAIGVIANLSAVLGIFARDPTPELVADTRAQVESADAKIDEILKLMRTNAALAGRDLAPSAEGAIETSLADILGSVDAAKAEARAALQRSDVDAAASLIEAVAAQQQQAAGNASASAAASWREAGALYASTNISAAIDAYEKSLALQPGDAATEMALAGLQLAQSNLDEAERLYVAIEARALPSSPEAGWAMLGRSAVADSRGEQGEARRLMEAALDLARRTGESEIAAVAASNLGFLLRREGSLEEAERILDFGLAEARRAGARGYEARALDALGLLAFSKGDPDLSVARLEEARRIHESLGDLRRLSTTIGNLGAVALERGDLAAAERHLEASVAIGERLGLPKSIAEDLNNLADLALRRNELDLADARLNRAMALVEANGLDRVRPFVEATAGQAAAARGDLAKACGLWSASARALEAMDDQTAQAVAALADDAGCKAASG